LLEEKFHDGVMVPVGQTTGTGGGFTRARISRRWWVRSIRPKIKLRDAVGDRRPPPLEAAQAEAGADKAVIPRHVSMAG